MNEIKRKIKKKLEEKGKRRMKEWEITWKGKQTNQRVKNKNKKDKLAKKSIKKDNSFNRMKQLTLKLVQ